MLKISSIVCRIAFFSFGITLAGLAMYAPIYQSISGYPHGEFIYQLLHPICHQYPTRSLWIMDRPFALCSRCFAGYFGFALASALFFLPLSYPRRFLLGVCLILPGVVDPLVQLLTPYESSNILRVVTGLLGGWAVFLILYPLSMVTEKRGGL